MHTMKNLWMTKTACDSVIIILKKPEYNVKNINVRITL